MTAWDDYLAAIGQLDDVRRDAAAAVADQERSVQTARSELAGVRHRIGIQRERIAGVATRAGRPLPVIEPHELDRRAAAMLVRAGVVDPTPGISAALRGAWATLDAADATLTDLSESRTQSGMLPGWPPRVRAALPYLWYAVLAVVALVFVNDFAGDSTRGSDVALLFDLVVPFGAYLLGLISAGMLFGPGPDGRKHRGVFVGAAICVVPLAIGLVLSIF